MKFFQRYDLDSSNENLISLLIVNEMAKKITILKVKEQDISIFYKKDEDYISLQKIMNYQITIHECLNLCDELLDKEEYIKVCQIVTETFTTKKNIPKEDAYHALMYVLEAITGMATDSNEEEKKRIIKVGFDVHLLIKKLVPENKKDKIDYHLTKGLCHEIIDEKKEAQEIYEHLLTLNPYNKDKEQIEIAIEDTL